MNHCAKNKLSCNLEIVSYPQTDPEETTVMSASSNSHPHDANSETRRQSVSSSNSDEEEEDFIDDDDSIDRSLGANGKTSNNRNKNKKTLGRVKIKMAYIDNKIRRYTTFSKRKTGIMKKAYELATLTGTEVMLLVASETGHVYTYATAKLQPMITSETGKALIQTCLAKDEPSNNTIAENPTTTLNNNDVICVDDSQRKKRTNASIDAQSTDTLSGTRPVKRPKIKSSDDLSSSSKAKSNDPSSSHVFTPQTTTLTLPVPYFIHPDPQQPQAPPSTPPSYTIDLNTLKNNGMNIIFAPSTNSTSSESPPPSNIPLVLTLGNFPYQPS